uniref:Uncharacterized protein n=1 Tax=Electrophorus electricus TaxID=8005 RepID=A0AAY5EMH3_ELEEL
MPNVARYPSCRAKLKMSLTSLPRSRNASGVVRWVHKPPPASDMFQAAVSGDQEWLSLSLKRALSATQRNKQGLTVLHVAAQYGRLDCVKLLVESRYVDVNAGCPRGRRPIHMVLSPQSRPHSYACLTYLLEQGADSTDEGVTPLHMAAAEGLRKCVETLVKVGANTHVCDSRGHTPFDLARLWGHRVIARFLKNAMWQRDKKEEMERCRALQDLRQTLTAMHRKAKFQEKALIGDKLSKWAEKKGLPLLWTPLRDSWTLHHAQCLSSEPTKSKSAKTKKHHSGSPREAWNVSPNPSRPPPASISRPQQVRMGVHPEKAAVEPDLHQSVRLHRSTDGRVHYTTLWDGVSHPMPTLPLDVVQRGLFPLVFPSRIASPLHFQCSSVLDLPRRGRTPQAGASPWTEVAMHLAEELEPGKY